MAQDGDDTLELPEIIDVLPDSAQAPRFPVDLRVVWDNGDRCASGPAINLSFTGIFIKTDTPPPVGKLVRIMPMINGENSNVVITGRVVRVGDAPARGMGVQFTPRTVQDRDRLERFVEAYAVRVKRDATGRPS